jgi:hypothetical protein
MQLPNSSQSVNNNSSSTASPLTSSINSANSASIPANLNHHHHHHHQSSTLNQSPLSSLQHTSGSSGSLITSNTANLTGSISGSQSSKNALQPADFLADDSDDNNPFDVAENRDYLRQQHDTMEINQLIINVISILITCYFLKLLMNVI